jgi:TonB family protein
LLIDTVHYFGFFIKLQVARLLLATGHQLLLPGGIVSKRTAAALLAVLTLGLTVAPIRAGAQQAQNEELVRRAKTKVQPLYPELARKMSISGTVKIEVVVAPNGTVKEARVVGGHPVLAGAALDAAKKWRFEPAPGESTGIIDFRFEPR